MRLMFIVAVAGLISGCADMQVKRNDNSKVSDNSKEIQTASFVFGFVPSPRMFQSELCPKGRIESMHMHMDSTDVLLTVATLGIYLPQHANVVCTGTTQQ